MEFEPVIGLEIHVEMKTKSKMFSSGRVAFGDDPNTNVVAVDMAFPGTMPVVNKQAVINAIRVCHAMNMTIDDELWFDRKNYFYSDLPKGYQITQQFRPIGSNGYIDIDLEDGSKKRINIERLHMEEDTCKQLHSWDVSLLDYNRAGIPLIEIVSKPELRSGYEAMKYVEKIRSIVTFLDVSDGKMEEGSLRCDVNISIREKGNTAFGTKVEIKNLNSLANIQKAIDFEISRQSLLVEFGDKVQQETRRFDEASKETVLMRLKTDSVDYKYFVDPNIAPIKLSEQFINDAINSSPELAEVKLARYKKLGLNEYDCSLLIADKDISVYFDELLKTNANPKLLANWVISDVQAVLNKNGISIKEFPISVDNLGKLILMIEAGKVSNKQAREIFEKMLENNANPEDLAQKLGTSLNSDEASIMNMINEVLSQNPQSIIDYKNGKDRALGFLVGQVMKLSHGQANPAMTSKLLTEELKRR
ncbi:MAG: Asp-tRNA(Asn)/Glu-tRNA(Gln) amidotransferase subunit GatB [Bacilli bacterium]|nr:Asp-tRNA(Asn)/Glu-tRNA(Gln) amidotransferase subunit GatB [Bacilli bacterium]